MVLNPSLATLTTPVNSTAFDPNCCCGNGLLVPEHFSNVAALPSNIKKKTPYAYTCLAFES